MLLAMKTFAHKNSTYPLYLWEWRKACGLSQPELAERTGIQRTLVSGIETGTRRANVDQLLSIAEALGVPVGLLFSAPEADDAKLLRRYHSVPEHRREQLLKLFDALANEMSQP